MRTRLVQCLELEKFQYFLLSRFPPPLPWEEQWYAMFPFLNFFFFFSCNKIFTKN